MQFVAQANRGRRILHSEGEKFPREAHNWRPDGAATERLRTIDEGHRASHLLAAAAHFERVHAFGKLLSADGPFHGRIGATADPALRVLGQYNEAFHCATQNPDRVLESLEV